MRLGVNGARRGFGRAGIAGVIGVLLALAFAGQAFASSVSVKWILLPVSTVGARPLLLYNMTLPRGDHAELQRLNNGRWVDVKALKASKDGFVSGSPLTKAGKYSFRIAVFNGKNQLVSKTSADTTKAVPRPSVYWNLPSTENTNAGTPISFTYQATKVPAGASVDVLEQNPKTQGWDVVAKVTSHSGSGTGSIPAQQLGKGLKFQIAVLDEGAILVYENTNTLNVFGQVPFSTLETSPGSPGTYTSPTATFTYQFGFQNPQTTPLLQVSAAANDCTSVNLNFMEGDLTDPSIAEQGDMDTLSVVQQSQSPVSSTVNFNQLGNLNAILVPGQSWSVTASSTGPVAGIALSGFLGTYLSGYAVCDTATPIIQVG
jgi:hypothetical protein